MPDPTSPFHTYAEFLTRWGLKNVTTASNKDGTAPGPDLEAVQQGFNHAQAKIEGFMRGGVYTVPFDFTDYGAVVDTHVKDWAMILAYVYIYESRGWSEKDAVARRFDALMNRVSGEMASARAGVLQLEAGINSAVDTAPIPVYAPRCYRRGLDGRPIRCDLYE